MASDLTRFRDHCRKRADDPRDQPATDVQLWARLADEVDRYLANDPDVIHAPTAHDTPLEFAE